MNRPHILMYRSHDCTVFLFKAKLIVAGPKVSSITVKHAVLENFADDRTNSYASLTVIDLL